MQKYIQDDPPVHAKEVTSNSFDVCATFVQVVSDRSSNPLVLALNETKDPSLWTGINPTFGSQGNEGHMMTLRLGWRTGETHEPEGMSGYQEERKQLG